MVSNGPIGAGVEDFKRYREKGYAYVDKTAMIKRMVDNPCAVALFTRPRRFGKTLAISMLRHFFEIGASPEIFNGLEIMDEMDVVKAHMGKYPVVSISLKDVQGPSMLMARGNLALAIRTEAKRFGFLSESGKLNNFEKSDYSRLVSIQGSDERLHESPLLLTQLLEKHFGKPAILLIDEYDVPLDKSWQNSYYDEMLLLVRSMFSLALKGNDSLEFAALTGCLRVSKESIFTEVNNFIPFSINNELFSDSFGFTEAETEGLLADKGLKHRMGEVREWYDGYNFAGTQIYCPWDVIRFCYDAQTNPSVKLKPYWMNTGGNAIIKQLANAAGQSAREEIGSIIDGNSIFKRVNEELTYSDMDRIDNIWSVMHAAGYLTSTSSLDDGWHELVIPNESVKRIYLEQIDEWFQSRVAANETAISALRNAFASGDASSAEAAANEILIDFISARDYSAREGKKEAYYHGLLLGALADMQGWHISSNEESGYGFWDIAAKHALNKIAFIIEVKCSSSEEALVEASKAALAQIEERQYWNKLSKAGAVDIMLYGAAFYKKECRIVSKRLELA